MYGVHNMYKKKTERERGTRNRSENLHRSTPLKEAGPVWLVRRCETLAANAVVLDNMWSKPVADHSEAEFLVTIVARESQPLGWNLWNEGHSRYKLTNRCPLSSSCRTRIVGHHFSFTQVFIAYLFLRIDLVTTYFETQKLTYSGLTSRWINQYLAFPFSLSYAANMWICFKQTSLLGTLMHYKGIPSLPLPSLSLTALSHPLIFKYSFAWVHEQYPVFSIENSNVEKYLLYASRYLSRWRDVKRQVSLLIHQFVDFPQKQRYFHMEACMIHIIYIHK